VIIPFFFVSSLPVTWLYSLTKRKYILHHRTGNAFGAFFMPSAFQSSLLWIANLLSVIIEKNVTAKIRLLVLFFFMTLYILLIGKVSVWKSAKKGLLKIQLFIGVLW